MNKQTFKRNQLSCPHCDGIIQDSYLALHPSSDIPCPTCNKVFRPESLGSVEAIAENERSATRCPVSLKVAYKSFDQFITEYTKNVSQGGMYISTTREHRLQEVVELFLNVPGIDHPLRVTGEVVRINTTRVRNEEPGIGIKFVDMDFDSRKILVEYIRSLKGCA